MPYLYHSFVSTKTDSADSGLVRPTNWNDRLEYSNAAATGPSGTDAIIRESLTTNRTYYVRTDGNDSNNGLTNTAGGAFLTLQGAYNTIVSSLDFSGQSVLLQVGAGTYNANLEFSQPWTGGGYLTIQGDTATPANVVISVTGMNAFYVSSALPNQLTIQGFKCATTTSGDCFNMGNNGSVLLFDMEWGACAGNHINSLTPGGSVYIFNPHTISGSAGSGSWIVAQNGGFIYNNATATLTGTPNFSTFAQASTASNIQSTGTFSGSATGVRYYGTSNGIIRTFGGGANYFPGNVAGVTDTGGLYS